MPNIAVPFEVKPTAAGMRADVRAGGIDKQSGCWSWSGPICTARLSPKRGRPLERCRFA